MNVLSQVMFGRYCPCDNNALVHNCHNANELYHNYHCLSRVLLLLIVMVGLVCISDHESRVGDRYQISGHSALWSLPRPGWKSAGAMIGHSPALNNNTSHISVVFMLMFQVLSLLRRNDEFLFANMAREF